MLVSELAFKENGVTRVNVGLGMQLGWQRACLAYTQPLAQSPAWHHVMMYTCNPSPREDGAQEDQEFKASLGHTRAFINNRIPSRTSMVPLPVWGLCHRGARVEMSRPGWHCQPTQEPKARASSPL